MITHIQKVAVVGAGYMGGGIAQSLALSGTTVSLCDISPDATRMAHARLLEEARQWESQGLFPAGATATLQARLVPAASIAAAVADADFIEEAVPEIPEIKREVFRRIGEAARPEAIIATNTSTLPVHTLADAVVRPERFLTVHFSNPAPFIPGVEIVAGERTDPAIVPVVRELLGRAGRHSAQVADTPGFVLNRLQYVLLKEAMSIVEEGIASPGDVDTIVSTTFGFRLCFFGPFAIADMAGLDVYANCFKTFEDAYGERFATPKLLKETVAAGHYGVKNGQGMTGAFPPDHMARLVAWRNTAYSRLNRLLEELGPAPAAVPVTPGGAAPGARAASA
jgi:3-hydroxybutyryl-CoA dehydrogenase